MMEELTITASADAQNINDLSAGAALELVKPFFPREWAKLDAKDVRVKKVTGGFCNSVDVVTRSSPGPSPTEPVSLLIKRKGGNVFDIDTFDEIQSQPRTLNAVIEYEMSRKGLGPKLYGLFKNGSVTEYIEGHTLTPEDIVDEGISGEFAQTLAAVHSIKGLPLAYDSDQKLWREISGLISKLGEKTDYIAGHEETKKLNVDMDVFTNFEFQFELDWVKKMAESVKMRQNFILLDMNFLNCLVRDKVIEGQSRIVLVDYDEAGYLYRGIDIGMHFFTRRVQYDNRIVKIIPGSTFPSVEERRRFLKVYQQEIKRLGSFDDFDENGIDSIENMIFESEVGKCFYCLMFSIYMLALPETYLDTDPSFLPMAQTLLELYVGIKKDFLEGKLDE